ASGEIRETSPETNSSSIRSPTHSTVWRAISCDKASKSNIGSRYRSAEAIGASKKTRDIGIDRFFERGEAAIVARVPQPIDITLGEVLIAVTDRLGHVDVLDIGTRA